MENWVSVFTTTQELDAGIVKDLLDEAGFPAVILNQKDSCQLVFYNFYLKLKIYHKKYYLE